MKYYIVLTIFISVAASADSHSKRVPLLTREERINFGLRIKSGAQISIRAYDSKKDVFHVTLVEMEQVGPLFATRDQLVKVVNGTAAAKSLENTPADVEGGYFDLKEDLWLLSPDEWEAQRKSK